MRYGPINRAKGGHTRHEDNVICVYFALDGGAVSGPVGRSLEGVEDQVEADLELVAVVVAGLEDVPGR